MEKLLKRKTLWISIGVIVIFGVSGFFAYNALGQSDTEVSDEPQMQTAVARRGDMIIFASAAGSIVPATEIGIGFKESGTLNEMLVNLGEQVEAGQVLASLETNNTEESIAASLASAQLNVLNAQRALDDIFDSWEMDAAVALLAVEEAEQDLDDLQNPALTLAQAMQVVAEAQQALENAQVAYNRTNLTASQANIDDAYADMIIARNNLDRAQERFDKYASKPEDNVQRAQAQSSLSAAQQSYDNAVANYNAAIGTASDTEKAIAEAGLATAQAQLIEAQRELERIQNGATPGEIALAEAQLASSLAEYERIKDAPDPGDIAAAEAQLANAQAQLALAEQEQVYIELVAPMNGTILSINASVGEQVGTGAIITLADLEQPVLEIYLDETDLDKLAVGYEVEVVFDAYPNATFTGQVVEVDPSLATVSNVQAVRALVALYEDSFLKPQTLPVGLNASVDVIGGRTENAVLVPVEALRELGLDEYAVFVVEDGEPKLRVVQVGLTDFTSAEIISGLEAGEVVTTGIVETE
ncbi:MAG: efflux RND transporter periplasmic adaptor subunit [Chloroflexota bacterium]|nr:efflux RND transporter periplasmic adaptor subunit [Chloroflexota bacterium]